MESQSWYEKHRQKCEILKEQYQDCVRWSRNAKYDCSDLLQKLLLNRCTMYDKSEIESRHLREFSA